MAPLWRRCASMRPPDLPGGNVREQVIGQAQPLDASMRPPDLPGGNKYAEDKTTVRIAVLQ